MKSIANEEVKDILEHLNSLGIDVNSIDDVANGIVMSYSSYDSFYEWFNRFLGQPRSKKIIEDKDTEAFTRYLAGALRKRISSAQLINDQIFR
jgi:hypothetical protein